MISRPDHPLLWFATDFKIDFNFLDFGVPAALVGNIDLPAGGTLRTPLVARPIFPAGAASTPKSTKPRSILKSLANQTQ